MTRYANNRTRLSRVRIEKAASGVIAVCAAIVPGLAQADTRAWIDTSIRAGVATNPYLQSGNAISSASATVSASPGVKFVDSVKTFSLRGNYQHTEFARRYRSSDNFSANANLSQQLSPRLAFNADIGFDTSIVGANDLLTFSPNPPSGGAFPPLPGDIALNGLRQRRQALNGGLGLDYTASTRDSFQLQGGFSLVRYPTGSSAAEYDSANGSFGYSRILDSRTSVGFMVGVSRADYRQTRLGDATTISPQLTFSTKFDARWSLTASLGLSHSSINDVVGKFRQDTAAGRLSLCNAGSTGKFCLYAARSVQPTSFGSTVRPQTSVGASYSVRLDTKSTIDATANLSRSGQISQGAIITGGSVDYGQASLTYTRRLSPRIQGYVTANYADSYRDPTPRKANASVNVGLSFSIGDTR